MPVQYNSKKIIPAPFVNVEKEYIRSDDGSKVGSNFKLTLTGKLVVGRGSPDSDGTFWDQSGYPENEEFCSDERLKHLIGKQEGLKSLFSEDGNSFEIQPLDGTQPMKCYPTVENITFASDGGWVDTVDYTITLNAPVIYGLALGDEDNFDEYLKEVEENWSLEFADQPENVNNPHVFRLTHNLNAVGQKVYDDNGLISNGWEQARDWVTSRLGLDTAFLHGTSGLNLPDHLQGYNHVRTESTDQCTGGYSVTETWLISSGNVVEDFTISKSTSPDSALTTVSIEGEIIGRETRNSDFAVTNKKWDAASDKFDELVDGGLLYTRAQTYTPDVTNLNSTPLSTTVGKNPVAGRINYTYEYDDRPSNCLGDDVVFEEITVNDTNSADVFASIPVLGRSCGPVLQDINTVTTTKRNVVIEVVVNPSRNCPTNTVGVVNMMNDSPSSNVQTLVDGFEENLNSTYEQVFVEGDNESWNPKTGRYNRNITWIFQ